MTLLLIESDKIVYVFLSARNYASSNCHFSLHAFFSCALVMGCGSSKVLPESSVKNGYVCFVKSVVGYSHKRKGLDDELQNYKGTQKDFWSVVQSSGGTGTQALSRILLPTGQDGQRHNKVAKYKAKFDPRVTAR